MDLNKYLSTALGMGILALAACGGGGGGTSSSDAVVSDVVQIQDSFGRTVYSGSSGGGRNSEGFGGGDSGADGSGGDGLPIVGGTVVITDANGKHPSSPAEIVTDSYGYFRANVTGLTPPFVASITKPDGTVRYSLSTTALKPNGFVTINITGLTSQIASDVAQAYGQAGAATLTPQILVANQSTLQATIDAKVAAMKTTLSAVIVAAGLDPATFDPLKAPFIPNYTGYDFVLDNTKVTSTPSTGSTVVSVPTTFVATSAIKATNLALALSEAKTFVATMNAAYATSAPTAAQITPFLSTTYLGNGLNQSAAAADFASYPAGIQVSLNGVAPYSGAPLTGPTPASNITYDSNNCVTSMWVNFSFNGLTTDNTLMQNTVPPANAAGVCSGGSWLFAGNQRQYSSLISTQLLKLDDGVNPAIYRPGLFFETSSTEAPGNYTSVEISGPGITTLANPSGTGGIATLVPAAPALNAYNVINDSYYGAQSNNPYYPGGLEGSSQLQDCANLTIGVKGNGAAWGIAPTASTPCLNMAATVAGSDYTITFKNGTTVLETDQQRLYVAPYNLPASFYPTIVSVTPAGSTLSSAGGVVTATWTLPAGAQPAKFILNINDANTTTLKNKSKFLGATATTASITVPALPAFVNTSSNGLPGVKRSFALIATTVGGVMVLTAVPF